MCVLHVLFYLLSLTGGLILPLRLDEPNLKRSCEGGLCVDAGSSSITTLNIWSDGLSFVQVDTHTYLRFDEA